MATNTTGSWSSLLAWPLVGIHATLTPDGKVLTFGTNPYNDGVTANMYHDMWDPVTGEHHFVDHTLTTPGDLFCATAIVLPGTENVMVVGGDASREGHAGYGISDVNLFNPTTHQVTPVESMAYARWYATSIALPNGQIMVMGGTDANGAGVAVPEIYTPGVGWTQLTGATGGGGWYPRMYVNGDGKVVVISAWGGNVELIDPSGNGTREIIGTTPFKSSWTSPSVEYAPGKVLINDDTTGLWSMDFSGATPTFTKVATMPEERAYGKMTVMANGDVLINGGGTQGNSEAGAVKSALIWSPKTGALQQVPSEDDPRLYHSSSLLLPDGSLLSLGGTSNNRWEDGQIYKPPYLFDATGAEAKRPVETTAPDHVQPGSSFTITVDNAADIGRLTLVKSGSSTHNFNSDSSFNELSYTVGANNVITVKIPDMHGGVSAGAYMLFAWNKAGVPAIAPMIQVDPTQTEVNHVLNGNFEATKIVGSTWQNYEWQPLDNSGIPGWKNLAQNKMELTKINGSQGIDLDVGWANDEIYQDIKTEVGKSYKLHFDVTKVEANSSAFDVLWNGKVVASISTPALQGYDFTVVGTGGADRLSFREFASQNNSGGAFLDNVTLMGTRPAPTYNNLLTNGDFEANQITAPRYWQDFSFQQMSNGTVTGWKNLNDSVIEVVKLGGTQGIETDVNAAKADAIFQDVKTEAGMAYKLNFDVIRAVAGTSAFDVVWNGNVVATVDPSSAKAYEYSVIGTGGNDRLMFRELAGQNDGVGAFLDNVTLKAAPAVQTLSDKELIVNGHFEDTFITAPRNYQDFSFQSVASLPGWKNTAGSAFELIKFGNTQGIDLDITSAKQDGIYQDIQTTAGTMYKLHLDVIRVTSNSSTFDVVWNDKVIATVNPTRPQSYDFAVTGTGGSDRLMFRELASQNDGLGAFIDNVSLKAYETMTDHSGMNMLVNGNLETMQIASGLTWQLFNNAGVPGWKNTNGDVELQKVSTGSGLTQGFEIDVAGAVDEIYQGVKTEAGKTYSVHFDVVKFKAGTSDFQVLWNGTVVTTISPTAEQGYDLSVIGTGGVDKLSFKELASQNNGTGAVIDNVSLIEPAVHGHGSTITITAAGSTGLENMALLIDGVQVASYSSIPTSGGVYTFNAASHVRADQVRVAFTNDVYDPANGVDRNLTIDKISIDGTTYQTEAATTYSTSTWTEADGIVGGYGRGDTLHTNGYVQYSSGSGGAEGSTITIDARGFEGTESIDLRIDGKVVATFANLSTTDQTLTYKMASGTVKPDQVSVAFTNDRYDPDNGIDSNVQIKSISIDGHVYNTTDPSVYSTGTWTEADGIVAGYGRGDTLHTNGYFQFSHPSLLSNGSFEVPGFGDGQSHMVTNAQLDGWVSSNDMAVIWNNGYPGQPGTNGANVVELNAMTGSLSQSVNTSAGSSYGLSFDLAGRADGIASSKVEVVWNNTVITTIAPTDSAFHQYHVNVVGTGGADALQFRSVTGDTDNIGALLDHVVLHDHAVA